MKNYFLPSALLLLAITACHKLPEKPSAFLAFEGDFIAQDTSVQRSIVWDSQVSNHLEILPPVANGTKKISIDFLPDEPLEYYNQDTTARMLLTIEAGNSYKVGMNQKGEFTWGDGNYIAPLSIEGAVVGDSFYFTAIRFNGTTGEYYGNIYRGIKQ